MSYFVELGLKFVDLADDVSKTSNLGIGSSHRSAGARRLVDGGNLGLRCELRRESCQQVATCIH